MNPLIRKEIRLLSPAWIVALVAATMPAWVRRDYEGVGLVLYGASVFFLGLASFGQEMTFKTFGQLLAQPEHRRRLWNIKAGLSALALVVVWGVLVWSLWLYYLMPSWAVLGLSSEFRSACAACGMVTLVAYAGGLWSALLLRDMIGAFFVSLLAPMVCIWGIFLGFSHWIQSDDQASAAIFSVLSAYSLAGFCFGRRLFLRAQDIPWAGEGRGLFAVKIPQARWFATGFPRRLSPWRAFARKECQQLEPVLVLSIFLALGHLAAIGMRYFYPSYGLVARELLDTAWVMWAIVPLVAGCIAVAEERSRHTHEGELCAPFAMRKQFVIKLALVLTVGIGVGGAVPCLLECGARAVGLGSQVDPTTLRWILLGGAAAVVLISFYASTLTNRLMPVFATVVCVAIGTGGTVGIVSAEFEAVHFWHRTIFICLEWPVMTATFFWLAYQNYKSVRAGWRIWLGNLGCVVAVFASVAVLAGGIYNRVWELVWLPEQAHDAARIAGPGHATIVDSRRGPAVLLPDGRLWIGQRDTNHWMKISGAFAPGSNWVNLAGCSGAMAAIKSDSTLWDVSDAAHVIQIGSDSGWKNVAADWRRIFGLKRDGTIWEWRLAGKSASPYWAYPAPDFLQPVRIGNDSDWADISLASSDGRLRFVKNDRTDFMFVDKPAAQAKSPSPNPVPDGNLVPFAVSDDFVQHPGSDLQTIGLQTNGTVVVMDYKENHLWHPSKYRDWIGAAKEFQDVWALAADGTLCCWEGDLPEDDARTSGPWFERRPFLRPTRGPVAVVNIFDSH